MKNIKLIRPCAFGNVAWTWKACSVCEQQLWTHLRTDWADQIEDMWLAVWVRSANNNKTLIVHTKTAALQFTVSTKCPSQNTIHKSITSFFSCVTAKEFSIHSICLNSLLLKASNILAFFFYYVRLLYPHTFQQMRWSRGRKEQPSQKNHNQSDTLGDWDLPLLRKVRIEINFWE